MRRMAALFASVVVGGSGCVPPRHAEYTPVRELPRHSPKPSEIQPVVFKEALAARLSGDKVGVEELVRFAVARNPRLAKATFAIDAAKGRHAQAGMYPNPQVAVTADELGDRTGPGGIITAPQVSQEIVTGRKLSLSQAVVAAEVDQAAVALHGERYAVVGGVRAAFYDLYALERRLVVLDELARLAAVGAKNGKVLFENQRITKLELIKLEAEAERFRAKAEAARQELPGARQRVAAAAGDPRLAIGAATGPFEDVPDYDPDRTLDAVLEAHPEVRSAQLGVERARAALRRAEAEPIPNVTVSTGYTYQGQNRSNDWLLGVSAPVPVWNRNRGNIRAANAELGGAVQEVDRVRTDLAGRVAAALRAHAAALRTITLYKAEVLPRGEETYRLTVAAAERGQFDAQQVMDAQRALAEDRLEYVKALGDAWKAAAELSALLMEEWWPGPPPGR
ncbi:MAG TPA: TolC family protein [Gemmataceae bacterium]|nr:TolC family protein [Gemmataceae bacterium]